MPRKNQSDDYSIFYDEPRKSRKPMPPGCILSIFLGILLLGSIIWIVKLKTQLVQLEQLPTSVPITTQTPFPQPTCCLPETATALPSSTPSGSSTLMEKFQFFPWVAYSPTNYDPAGQLPSEEQIREDLDILYSAGFRGIVTYGSDGILAEIPRIARDAGFEGVIAGIWMPGDPEETMAAIQALPYVDGYAVGNEGLSFDRYSYETLEKAVNDLRQETGKPVATSEVFSTYFKNEKLFQLGDWIFPTVHPYWADITDPIQAVRWTEKNFDEFVLRGGNLPVIFKEVGLPSSGTNRLSEYQQAEYYVRLRESDVTFVYFEAFDQSWKKEGTVGEHWGLFNSDRTPKVASQYILNGYPPFYVYADADASYNHFVPEGFMGCWSGLKVDENDTSSPFSGNSAIKITYSPCLPEWGGVYWWDPPKGNWCAKDGGFDLTGWNKVSFLAKGQEGGEYVEFKVGGLKTAGGADCDSMTLPQTTYPFTLSKEWEEYTISLYGEDLSHVAGGFVWVTESKEPITIFLDEIKFGWSEE